MDNLYYWIGFAVFWCGAVASVGFVLIFAWFMFQEWREENRE